MRNFHILIVSAVKLCKQCLQTASASGGLCPPDPLLGLRLWTPLFPTPLGPGLQPQMKIPGAAHDDTVIIHETDRETDGRTRRVHTDRQTYRRVQHLLPHPKGLAYSHSPKIPNPALLDSSSLEIPGLLGNIVTRPHGRSHCTNILNL